ncbi:MAG: hypothetical protein H0X34_17845 [Chthoniobacterales bacterium]|nr:hypothetical protein [Chthoniobacterales bacterium]
MSEIGKFTTGPRAALEKLNPLVDALDRGIVYTDDPHLAIERQPDGRIKISLKDIPAAAPVVPIVPSTSPAFLYQINLVVSGTDPDSGLSVDLNYDTPTDPVAYAPHSSSWQCFGVTTGPVGAIPAEEPYGQIIGGYSVPVDYGCGSTDVLLGIYFEQEIGGAWNFRCMFAGSFDYPIVGPCGSAPSPFSFFFELESTATLDSTLPAGVYVFSQTIGSGITCTWTVTISYP